MTKSLYERRQRCWLQKLDKKSHIREMNEKKLSNIQQFYGFLEAPTDAHRGADMT